MVKELNNHKFRSFEQPLLWKGVELSTNRPFLLFVLSKHLDADSNLNEPHLCRSSLQPLSIVVVVFNATNSWNNQMIQTVLEVSICHGLCCNPSLTPSFNQKDEVFRSNIPLNDISRLIVLREIRINGNIWILERDWSRMLSVFSRFKCFILRYKLISFCVVMTYGFLGLSWFLTHSAHKPRNQAIVLAFLYLASLFLLFCCCF